MPDHNLPNLDAIRKAEEQGLVFSEDKRTLLECTNKEIIEAVIPDGVTTIGDPGCPQDYFLLFLGEKQAFYNCENLIKVLIPNSVTSIEYGAFGECSNLSEIVIPNGVKKIGGRAFLGCSSLEVITIPPSVIELGKAAFCGVQKVISNNARFKIDSAGVLIDTVSGKILDAPQTISKHYFVPDGVTCIEDCAFKNCTKLSKITLSNSVYEIKRSAFWGCSNLSTVVCPDSVTSIGSGAFRDCIKLTNITLPTGITEIEDSTFFNCPCLTNINIPNGVKKIGDRAFCGCISLEVITIPPSVIELGDAAFCGVKDIISNNERFDIDSAGVIIDIERKKIVSALQSIHNHYFVPDFITEINAFAFLECDKLIEVTIPKSVTKIGYAAFQGAACEAQVKHDYPHLYDDSDDWGEEDNWFKDDDGESDENDYDGK